MLERHTSNQRCNWNEGDGFGISVTIDSNSKKKEEETDKKKVYEKIGMKRCVWTELFYVTDGSKDESNFDVNFLLI